MRSNRLMTCRVPCGVWEHSQRSTWRPHLRISWTSRRASRSLQHAPGAAELVRRKYDCRDVVGLDGLEPTTSVLSGPRSNRLSYRPAYGMPALFGSIPADAASSTVCQLYPAGAGQTSRPVAATPDRPDRPGCRLPPSPRRACRPEAGDAQAGASFRSGDRPARATHRWETVSSAPGS